MAEATAVATEEVQPAPAPEAAPRPVAEPAPEAPSEPEPRPVWRPRAKHPVAILLILLAALGATAALASAWNIWPLGGRIETTENAYVRGRTTVIAPQVSGYVVAVLVQDYQDVRAGQPLVRVDDRIYRARVAQAEATLHARLADLANSAQAHSSRTAGLQSQVASLASANAELDRSRAEMKRVDELKSQGWITAADRDRSLANLRHAEAAVRQASAAGEIARQDIRSVDVGRGGLEAQVEAAEAALRLAQIDLANTVIRAPESGRLGEIGVRLGQYVTNGSNLLSLVPPDRWIIANFKEAQTAAIAPGQKATATIDALGGAKITGRVEELAPAAGSEFAVLKPDNATGNFVKVPQRIGVRIAVDPDQELAKRLRPGMSVRASVETD